MNILNRNLAKCGSLVLCAALVLVASSCTKSGEITKTAVTEDQSLADGFIRHTVTGIKTALPQAPDVPGFIGASYLTIGDVDGDGIKEIIATSGIGPDGDAFTHDGAVAIFTRAGASLDSWKQSVINASFAFANETVLRDMDADGDNDIMVMDNFIGGWATGYPAGIYYLENRGEDITDPSNWVKHTIFEGDDSQIGKSSYHRAIFVDLDGDGREDFITSKVCMYNWQNTGEQYTWMEWFKKETDMQAYPSGYSGPYEIGNGGGFMFNVADVDGDGDLDILAPQFFVQNPGGLVVKGPGDTNGDTLAWFENPGPSGAVASPWNRCTIDNRYSSSNPMGKGFEVVSADLNDDGIDELVMSNHNHQEYKPVKDTGGQSRIWPSGIYCLQIPAAPKDTAGWKPVSLDTGNPELDPADAAAVTADVYAVDRPGGPYSQGSPGMVRAADMDGDGFAELVVPGDGKGALYYYHNDGMRGATLSLRRAALYRDPACMPGEAEIVDIDGDGDMDVVAAIYDTSVKKDSTSGSIFVFEKK
jgi:hypothetical protein